MTVLQSFGSPFISLQALQRPKVNLAFPWKNSSSRHSFPIMALLQNNAPKNITSSITILVNKMIAIFRTGFFYTPTTCCTQNWIFFQLRYCDIDTAILFGFFLLYHQNLFLKKLYVSNSIYSHFRSNFANVLLIHTIRKCLNKSSII